MVTGNSAKRPREIFATSNKYQDKIVLLVFVPSALIFLTFIFIVLIGNPGFSKALLHVSFFGMTYSTDQLSGAIILLMCSLYLLSLIKAFTISHHMVGASGRIIRELDEIIAGGSKKTISSRPGDTLTKELLKRINVLTEHYVEHKKKNS